MTAPHVVQLRELLASRAGQGLDDGKEYLVEARLAPIARELGVSIPALVEQARRDTRLATRVVEAMCIHETSWYRDQHPFEVLRTEVFPAIIRARPTRRLQLWSAACSTGQEPYTLAMLCAETPQLTGANVSILGTDLSTQAVERAQAGRYSHLEIGRGLPASQLVKYFERQGTEWAARKVLRDMVSFRQMNLAAPFGAMPRCDVVLLRNVMIYFPVDVRARVLASIHAVMPADGVLLLGASESLSGVSDRFTPERHGRTTIYRPA